MGRNFTGPAGPYKDQWSPPDANGDVGRTDYVEVVNTTLAVFDKASGKAIYGAVPTNTIWSGFGGPCQDTNDGDATVKYDREADRWVIQQMSTRGGAYLLCIAVSTSNDPTGTWYRYSLTGFGSNVPDYPKLSIWPDAYYLTFNLFLNDQQFVGAELCALDRGQMLAGNGLQTACFTTGYDSLLPADADGGTPPPVGASEYLLSLSSDHLNQWSFHVDWSDVASSTLTGPTSIQIAPFTVACIHRCVPQPGVSQKLDTQADRLMYRLVYRNFGDHESLLASHAVKVGTSIAVRWYEIRNLSSPSVYQQGTYAPDTTNRWMSSAAMDQSGDIGISYSASSASVYPGLRYTGWTPWDQLGNLESEQTLVAGSASQTGTARWGDYASVSIDPSDDCTFWVAGQYMPATGSLAWSTAVGTFRFPSCGTPPAPPSAPSLTGTAGNGFASLAWNTPANGGAQIGGYNIYRGDASGGETLLASLPATATSYRDTSVVNFNQYYYRVTATNSVGESAGSTEVLLLPVTTVAAASVLAGTAANRTVTLSWSAPDDGGSPINGYNIYRGGSPGGEALVAEVDGLTTTYSDTTNFGSAPVYYEVTAVNGVGESALSDEVALMPTAVALTTSVSPSVYGQTIILTATVAPLPPGGGTPSGTVTFMDGGAVLKAVTINKGKASYSSKALKVGSHAITAVYNGSVTFLTSQAGQSQAVAPATTIVTMASSANPSVVGQAVTLTAVATTLAPGSGTPSGSVVFQDGGTTVATVSLANGTATYKPTFQTSGTHQITATYKGNASFLGSGASLAQSVN